MASESKGTVVLALTANLAIAVAKTVGGLISLSSALLAEAAHSWADTLNEIFLITALRKSTRPADSTHPFGYGKERFFWSLLAAIGIFVTGGLFSFYQGVTGLIHGGHDETSTEYLITYAILVFSLLAEGSSLRKAVKQVQGEATAAGRGFFEHLRRSSDPTVKTVASEDSAAVTGLLLALAGTALHQVTGSEVYDAAASIGIGLVLVYVAFALGRDTKDMLIGEAADPELRLAMARLIRDTPGVDAVLELLTMQMGPDELLVAVRVDFSSHLSSSDVEQLSTAIEGRLHEQFSAVHHVFLDATSASPAARERAKALAMYTQAQADVLAGRADKLSADPRLGGSPDA